MDILLYLDSLKLSRGGWGGCGGWLGGLVENLFLMKTQSSACTWTWTLDFDLGFVNIDKKVENYHRTLRENLDLIFPEKTVKISTLDRKWMTPQLKKLIRKIKREFYMHKKSPKWRRLKSRFKKLKRNTVKQFYNEFVTELKSSNPGK